MSTQAQVAANQANAQFSTGPKSEAGKAVSSKNNLRHGLTGPFVVLSWESQEDYRTLRSELFAEHQPATLTEEMIVDDMAQSHWLRKRAITLQHMCFRPDMAAADHLKELALYLRYQTAHDRAFYKALNQLTKLRAEKRKSENGFVSQQRSEAEEKRREAQEIRRQEMHEARVWLVEAQAGRHDTEKRIAEAVKMPRETRTSDPLDAAKAA